MDTSVSFAAELASADAAAALAIGENTPILRAERHDLVEGGGVLSALFAHYHPEYYRLSATLQPPHRPSPRGSKKGDAW